jgi:large subunit ribosomal protein L20
MPRTTKGNLAAKKHRAVLARTKGHYGARSRPFKTAKQSLIKSMQYAYRDRKNRKRDFRRLWITRINAGVRVLGFTYSKFIAGLNKKNIELDRKMLSELAIQDKATFEKVVKTAID